MDIVLLNPQYPVMEESRCFDQFSLFVSISSLVNGFDWILDEEIEGIV
jgi:hypothetical protein